MGKDAEAKSDDVPPDDGQAETPPPYPVIGTDISVRGECPDPGAYPEIGLEDVDYSPPPS
jgi:hypothetical protein